MTLGREIKDMSGSRNEVRRRRGEERGGETEERRGEGR